MGKMLHVENLGFGVSSSDLQRLFARYGNIVSAEVVTSVTSCRSKGFGFVELGSDAEAQAAIAGLDGKDYAGRPLKVYEAKPCEDRSSYAGDGLCSTPSTSTVSRNGAELSSCALAR